MPAKKMLRRFLEFLARDAEAHPEKLGDVGDLIAGDDALLNERTPGHVYPEGYDLALALRSVGPGWHGLVKAVFEDLPEGVVVEQVKQKLGGLRIYLDDRDDEDHDRVRRQIRAAELAASKTCEVCGQRGWLRRDRRGWIITLCDEDAARDDRTLKNILGYYGPPKP